MESLYQMLSEGRKYKIKTKKFAAGEIKCIYLEARHPIIKDEYKKLSEAEKKKRGCYPPIDRRSFECADGIICEQDVEITMRDGVKIYVDIFRPITEERIPAILAWSGYGKQPRYERPDLKTRGVAEGAISEFCKEEGPDPLYWCRYGYAVVNVDPRGVGNSEGDFEFFGTQDGRDGYDAVEWLSKQKWCNGKIGMAGNSCLAMMQWRIAAERPPHLACIAPWEGTGDMYRESLCEGGIVADGFPAVTVTKTIGGQYVDDMVRMVEEEPFVTSPYWQDKIPKFENIEIPTYVTAGWSHLHLKGSIEGFRSIKSENKWLRCHREFEWPDFYNTGSLEELRKFFDRYLKEIYNGWEQTPRVRIEVMDAYAKDFISNRAEADFPLSRTRYRKLYLNAFNCNMEEKNDVVSSSVIYRSDTEKLTFEYTFSEETELTGFMKLKLWVEALDTDDMDLYINIKKATNNGNEIPTTVLGCNFPGPWGRMRVSRRHLDREKSELFRPVQTMDRSEKLKAGEIVPVEIEIAPTSRIWHKNEKLLVQIAGRYIREDWFEPHTFKSVNKGRHKIYTGGRYDSYLQIPVIPEKLEDDFFKYIGI